jgi:XTP/dITP diphosphohydrolase
MKLIFATHNSHKLSEVAAMLPPAIELIGLSDIGCTDNIAETASTLEGNALIKARYIRDNYHRDCFADDTGLEVKVLNNAPGVLSARYAGEPSNPEANMTKLLGDMEGATDRRARFRTVIALSLGGNEYLFEGIVNGQIATQPSGDSGFGYDPIFIPEGYAKTFGELSPAEKNKISHRAIAIAKLTSFLTSQL